MSDFTPYGKTPRLFRDVIITEKVDGSNGGILIQKYDDFDEYVEAADGTVRLAIDIEIDEGRAAFVAPRPVDGSAWTYVVRAQSRKRYVFPGQDNFGFGAWVHANAETLVEDLGEGLHFGEWFGKGIQRGYGLDDRYFAVFNVHRFGHLDREAKTPNLTRVPDLYRGAFSEKAVRNALDTLSGGLRSLVPYLACGSLEDGGEAEGVIVYHTASGQVYKVLMRDDHLSKTEAGLV